MKFRLMASRLVKRHVLKIIVCAVVFVLLFTSFLLMGTYASSNNPVEAAKGEQSIIVHTGDTLWDIAKRYSDGSQDVRYIIFMIKDRNQLQTSQIIPGQKLIIPSI
ncbi:LysM peptidoglycan-binding domain-containing protein [Paenibacillus sp. FSL H8-0548]|uniref:cell division suppressor protein YneA n=1 Tax=Paenibacillus sp. FSL H8-0548 TaxID=1920422 RepID=UPI0015C2F803|nr:LysM peptidoglycan-binding domain-containing protein [Paenibacillus sp. FSL H8-0548]